MAEAPFERNLWSMVGRELAGPIAAVGLALGAFIGLKLLNQVEQLAVAVQEMKVELAVIKFRIEPRVGP